MSVEPGRGSDMQLLRLRIHDLRIIERADLTLSARWNLFLGANGAGKTSVLEAAFLLSHGRSFRTGAKEALTRSGCRGYSVFGEIQTSGAKVDRVGVARTADRLEARHNGEPVSMADLLRRAAVLCFEPGSHELIAGASELRRRFLDWGVFHVEPDFMACWRRYQRVLKQRNAALRAAARDAELDVWDPQLAGAAEPLTQMRARYVERLRPVFLAELAVLLPELGAVTFSFHEGSEPDLALNEALGVRRARDRARGHTSVGPHRADWSLVFEQAPRREYLSRGQEKLCAFAAVMAQARLFAEIVGEWPIIGLDDISSELDLDHQRRIFASVQSSGAQILATATEGPAAFDMLNTSATRFHVEQGGVTALL